jgi:hypothetical protein
VGEITASGNRGTAIVIKTNCRAFAICIVRTRIASEVESLAVSVKK